MLKHYSKWGAGISGINLKLTEPYLAPMLSQKITENLSPDYIVSNWTDQYGPLFSAIKLEKTMMFFILLLIVAWQHLIWWLHWSWW